MYSIPAQASCVNHIPVSRTPYFERVICSLIPLTLSFTACRLLSVPARCELLGISAFLFFLPGLLRVAVLTVPVYLSYLCNLIASIFPCETFSCHSLAHVSYYLYHIPIGLLQHKYLSSITLSAHWTVLGRTALCHCLGHPSTIK